MKKITSIFLIFAIVLTLFGGMVTAAPAAVSETGTAASLEEELQQALLTADERKYADDAPEQEDYDPDPDEVVRVIVEMQASSGREILASSGMSSFTTQASLEAQASAEALALRGQENAIASVRRNLGLEPVHRSGYLVNTVSYDIRRGDIEMLEKTPGVVSVTEAQRYTPEMFSAKEMANVYEAWKMGNTGYTGKGMAIAIIDSGVNWEHRDMIQNPDTAKFSRAEMQEKIDALGYGQWFTDKVPFGHSYVSGHDAVISEVEAHGHHVAGIAAANGDENNSRISGVAPDAQIFAMQVFDTVTGEGGYTDDIVCAIEDAVKLGADVINMSLGTDSGFYGKDRYIEYAVDRAQEAGVFVAVAAGNSGMSSDRNTSSSNTTITNDWNLSDTALVATPSTAEGATSVASVDGHGFLTYQFSVTPEGQEERKITCARLTYTDFTASNSVTFAEGLSKSDGTIAVVAYNPDTAKSSTITNQIYQAISKGYAGVIFYNQKGGITKSVASSWLNISLPAAFVSKEDGEFLLSLCQSGTVAKMSSYATGYFFATEEGENKASFFTSWGPTPSLEIKPEIAAPGGSIMSVADGTSSYMIMSGTSMASPFIAGCAAVVKQYIQESGMKIDNIPEFIRISLMNTAAPVYETNTDALASVRQVGAGMVDLEQAVRNQVTATYNGKAAIELRDQLSAATTGEILLTNYGTEAVTYTLSATDVYTDTTDEGTMLYHNTVLEGASVTFEAEEVTVPAGETAVVRFTLNLPSITEGHFAEGYIRLATDSAPSLSLPFMGFMGSWDEAAIIDAPSWEEDAVVRPLARGYYGYFQHGTGLVTLDGRNARALGEVYYEANKLGCAYIDPDRIAISPNGDGIGDLAIPWLACLRNAEEVRMDVLDQAGNVIESLGSAYYMRKIQAYNSVTHHKSGNFLNSAGYYIYWDGSTYDQSTGQATVVPEGDYQIRLQARVREGGQWQTVTMPIAVDLTKPEIELFEATRSSGTVQIQLKATDAHAISDVYSISLNGTVQTGTLARWTYNAETQVYSSTIKLADYGIPSSYEGVIQAAIMVEDNAGNTAVALRNIDTDAEKRDFEFFNLKLNKVNYVYAYGSTAWYRVFGYATEGSSVTFNGEAAEFQGDNFSIMLPLTRGDNIFHLEVKNPAGETLTSTEVTIHAGDYLSEFSAPILLNGFRASAAGNGWTLVLDQDYPDGTEIPIRIKIMDPEKMIVSTGSNKTVLTPDENGYVYFTATLYEGSASFDLWLDSLDGYNYIGRYGTILNASLAKEKETNGEDMSPLYQPQVFYETGFSLVTPDMLQKDGLYHIQGYLYNPVDKVTVNGVDANINADDLTWECGISLKPGVNNVPIIAEKDGKSYYTSSQTFVYEEQGPDMFLDLPEEEDGKYYMDTDSYVLRGTVTTYLDDAQVYLNGIHILGDNSFGHLYDEERVTREFSYKLDLVPGDNIITVWAFDYMGMSTSKTINLYLGERPVCKHESTEVRDAKRATCTEEGYTGDTYCKDCGELVIKGEVIPAMGHSLEHVPAKAATARTNGNIEYWRCTVCGKLFLDAEGKIEATWSEIVIPATGGEAVTPIIPSVITKPVISSFPFTDVSTSDTYYDAVKYVYEEGLMNGVSDAKFAPASTLTRAMVVTILYRIEGEPATRYNGMFPDVPNYQWYTDAVEWAAKNNIVTGYTTGKFGPEDPVTREQLAAILYRYAQSKGYDVSASADLSAYADASNISSYAVSAVKWAVAEGILEAQSGKLEPRAEANRAQVAIAVASFHKQYVK